MKVNLIKISLIAAVLGNCLSAIAQDYKMQAIPIQTPWAKEVNASNALPEYPRPQLVRGNWQNLNGLWDYAITKKDAATPKDYAGKILVPFPIESALSGVKKAIQPDENLWYKRTFSYNGKGRTLLHFGAVDFETTVFVNGKEAGKHTGGYTEFTFDVTSLLEAGENELMVKVWDPTDQGYGPHGKQVLNPQNIYYTPTSGIWQTVWLESVPDQYIQNISMTPDIDKKLLNLTVNLSGNIKDIDFEADGYAKGQKVVSWHSARISGNELQSTLNFNTKAIHLWSPGDPFLYDLIIRIKKGGKVVDEVKSYFAMRKSSIVKDEQGMDRIALNNKPYFNLGTLDQGFWPDGLYTAPTDKALAFDIKAIKAMGFNTIRKHIKIEPARWYYYCDKLGMLVWQDFVNPNQGLPEGSKAAFEKQGAEEMIQLHNYPSITTWVLFNEKWGQYDQERLTKWVKTTDPSRIVNGHTGEILYVNDQLRSPSPNAYVAAEMTDVHSYPYPMMSIRQTGKAQVCGEFGGIGVFIPDHQWNSSSAWGYVQEKPANLRYKYEVMNQQLELYQRQGLSGSIYTQPFDVEGEQNGLMTYDRKVIKVPFETLRQIHSKLNPDANIDVPEVKAENADLTDPTQQFSEMLNQYLGGKRDKEFLKKLAMTASQQGDKAIATEAGSSLIQQLQGPVSEEDLQLVLQFTTSTQDPGFKIIQSNMEHIDHLLGTRQATIKMMNMIFHGEMEALINAGGGNPDWKAIEAKAKPFGAPGEEILLRAETVHYLNHQDWEHFTPVAKQYLQKYGANLPENEKQMFQQAIDQHQ